MDALLGFGVTGAVAGMGILGVIIKPLLIFLLFKFFIVGAVTKLASGLMSKTSLDIAIQNFVMKALRIALWAFAIIMIADSFGIDTTSFVAVVSVVSLALSLAFQNIMTNVFSGIVILLSKPFTVGDYVDVAGVSGTVKEINLVRTKILTVDNKVELIPNGHIESSNVTNYSAEPLRRVDLKFSASYDASTDAVKEAIMEVINADVRIKNEDGFVPFVRLSAYNANDIEYTVRVWTDNANYWGVYFDTMEAVRESFAKHNIEFSYPHTVVHMAK